jgi:hypothetical protein
MGRTDCTKPQCLYKGALLPLYIKLHGFKSQKKNLIITAAINAVACQMASIIQSTQLCFIKKRSFVLIKRCIFWLVGVIIGRKCKQDRQRNMEARSCNHRCRGKVVNITYSECVSIALFTHHEKRMSCIILWPIWLYHIRSHHLTNGTFSDIQLT